MAEEGQTPNARDLPPPPPEVEQAILLGHVSEAVSLYIRHTGIDEETARAEVDRIASA